jgi:hypothetical protein
MDDTRSIEEDIAKFSEWLAGMTDVLEVPEPETVTLETPESPRQPRSPKNGIEVCHPDLDAIQIKIAT